MSNIRTYSFPQAVEDATDAEGRVFAIPAGEHEVDFGVAVPLCDLRLDGGAVRISREALVGLCKAGRALPVFTAAPPAA